MFRIFLRTANFLLSFFVVLCLLLSGAYAAYALWDNNQIYSAAENVREDMLKLKPQAEEGEQSPGFQELQAINPDVCAWVSLDNTQIDHPVLQGQDNLSYINTDVYGNFSLSGSIFLDSRNSRDFGDAYSLLYGHHMENSGMFGDLALYKEGDFFDENSSGELILPQGSYSLEIFACLLVDASDDNIFEPERWRSDASPLADYAAENSLHFRREVLDRAAETGLKVLALSTCSTEFSDARTVVLACMFPSQFPSQEGA